METEMTMEIEIRTRDREIDTDRGKDYAEEGSKG